MATLLARTKRRSSISGRNGAERRNLCSVSFPLHCPTIAVVADGRVLGRSPGFRASLDPSDSSRSVTSTSSKEEILLPYSPATSRVVHVARNNVQGARPRRARLSWDDFDDFSEEQSNVVDFAVGRRSIRTVASWSHPKAHRWLPAHRFGLGLLGLRRRESNHEEERLCDVFGERGSVKDDVQDHWIRSRFFSGREPAGNGS